MSDKVVTEKVVTPDGEVVLWESTSFFKTPFNHDTSQESVRTGYLETLPSKAQQHQAEEADINTIVKRFNVTGQLPQIPLPPALDEFAEVFDFQTAMNTLAAAKRSFEMLPADIRAAFGNDPHQFVGTVDNMLAVQDEGTREGNLKVLRAMGLAVTPGPVADKTTLGDVLAAIREKSSSGDSPAPKAPAAS